MAPRQQSGANVVKSKCATVKSAIEHAECADTVKAMLARTISLTVGAPKAERHPFNERFVVMIQEVLAGEQARLQNDSQAKEATFNELSPAKATREAALEQAQAVSAERTAALETAKQAVTEIAATLKEAGEAEKAQKKAQKAGDAESVSITNEKTALENTVKDSLAPLVEGTGDDEAAKNKQVKAVLDTGKKFGFDESLLSTAEQVLHKAAAERGAFDATCLDQLKDAFTATIAKYDEQLAAGAPAKAERAAAVEQAEATHQATQTSQADLKEKAAAAKEAKGAADAETKLAAKSLHDFMPDLKVAGDSLDAAKEALQSFIDGPQVAFHELKDFKEGDFDPKVPEPVVEPVVEAPQETLEESPSKRARTEETPA